MLLKMTASSYFVKQQSALYNVNSESTIFKYITRKTKASERDSKARRSLGNLYALYVLCADYVNGNENGATFTDLMERMKAMPFGAKLQNHPLDNRLNDEVRRQYGVDDNLLPVQVADFGDGRKARKISVDLLSEHGMSPLETASFVVASIDEYIKIIDDKQTEFLNLIELSETEESLVSLVHQSFQYSADARLFEIVSFALLKIFYNQKTISYTYDDRHYTERFELYRTGRTNANDGGIDFVLKPLGKFFQVTETLDFKKYFLDFDKINRFELSFVIKTDKSSEDVRNLIRVNALRVLTKEQVDDYMKLFDEIFTLNELQNILSSFTGNRDKINELKSIIAQAFRVEYGLLD